MGKSKCRKARRNRVCPTGLPDMKEMEDEEEFEAPTFNKEKIGKNVQYILDLLQSPGVEDKECGACSIANIANQPGAVPILLKSNIIKILGPLLLDSCSAVRHSVSGALRNLSACGGHDACDAMVDEDVMTPLVALLKTYEECWAPAQCDSKIDSKTETFIQAVHLLWNLCESNNIALSVFNKQHLLPILTQCLSVPTYGTEVVTAVAQCLHTVSEDNEEVITYLSAPSVQEKLQAILESTEEDANHLFLKALASGIVLNLYGGQLSRCSPNISSFMTSIFESTLNIGTSGAMKSIAEIIVKIQERNKHVNDAGEEFERKEPELEKYCTQCSNLLSAKQTVLELLTNICCSDDADDWDDVDSSDTGGEENVLDDEMEISECWTGDKKAVESCIPHDIREAVIKRGLLGKILDHLAQSDDCCSILKQTPKGRDILKKLHTVKCRALLCLHNIVDCLNEIELGTYSEIHPVWCRVAQLAFKQTDVNDTELLEAATSALRALTQKLAATEDSGILFQGMPACEMQPLFQVGQQCPEEAVRTNVVRIIGTVGCILANPRLDGSCPAIKTVGQFLLDTAIKDSHLWVVAEALDCIFDVFGEDHLDPVAQEICLVEKLKAFLPNFKCKLNQQKKWLGQHRAVVTTAKTNLFRFIQYKSKQEQK